MSTKQFIVYPFVINVGRRNYLVCRHFGAIRLLRYSFEFVQPSALKISRLSGVLLFRCNISIATPLYSGHFGHSMEICDMMVSESKTSFPPMLVYCNHIKNHLKTIKKLNLIDVMLFIFILMFTIP